MKTPHLLILAGSLSAVILGAITLQDRIELRPSDALPVVISSGAHPPGVDHGGGVDHNVDKLLDEMLQLKHELAAVRESHQQLVVMQNALSALQEDISILQEAIGVQESGSEYQASQRSNPLDVSRVTEQDPVTGSLEDSEKDYQRMQDSSNAFATEPIDEAWSANTIQLITQAFENDDFTSISLGDVECRSSTCQAIVYLDDAQAAEEFSLKFTMSIGDALPNISYHYEHYDDGQVGMVMYLERNYSQ
jgi:hypothetical protein